MNISARITLLVLILAGLACVVAAQSPSENRARCTSTLLNADTVISAYTA
jgi:hypothetical protein